MLDELKAAYGDDLRIVYRHLPLITIHDKAQVSAEASEAAGAQGMFWEMHDIMFERQNEWNAIADEAGAIEKFVEFAEAIGLEDVDQFQADLEGDIYAEKVLADYNAATTANLSGTPSFFMNQVDYPAQAFGLSYQGLDTFIRLIQLQDRWFTQPEQVLDPDKSYVAKIETEQGEVVLELFADTAPVNVNSFAFLAQEGWYKDVSFHRVLDGFMAQGGDPTGTGVGFPGYRCADEVSPTRSFDGPGVVALANSGPNTNGGQFFITFGPTPHLDPNFTIIGQVIEGQEIIDGLTRRDPASTPDAPPGDRIIDITIEEAS